MRLQLRVFKSLLFIFAVSRVVFAQSIPTPEEALRVIDFYYNGKGQGVILTDSKICRDIHKSGLSKYDCKNEIIEFGPLTADGSPPEIFHRVNLDETVYVWMAFLVPLEAEEKIYLRFNLDGETRRTSGLLTVKGALRFRTWSNFTPTATGNWEIEIFHESDFGPKLLGSFTLTVQ